MLRASVKCRKTQYLSDVFSRAIGRRTSDTSMANHGLLLRPAACKPHLFFFTSTQPWSSKKPLEQVEGQHLDIRVGRRVPYADLQAIKAIRSEQEQEVKQDAAVQLLPRVTKVDVWDNKAVSHSSGVAILFLGTGAGGPAEQRRAGCIALKLQKSTWLFDAGEDTQRQVHKQPLVRNGKVDRIFITNRRSTNVLGLPGLLCTMSGARSIGLDVTDVPLHIYGPPGLSEFIRPMLHLSDTYIAMPVVVHELVEHAIDPEIAGVPVLLDKRCCLYRVLVPPDKLNPQGYTNVMLERMLDRGTHMTKGMAKKEDERVNHLPLQMPQPGDVNATIEGLHELRWTFQCEKERSVTAVKVPAEVDSFAFVMNEANRTGKLNVEAAERYGIHGSGRNDIKAGLTVVNKDGETIRPEQICGPDIVGRKIVVVGESTDSSCLADDCHDADALLHAASCYVKDEYGSKDVQSTIDQATHLTKTSGARHLLLYRFKPANGQDGSKDAANAPAEDEQAFGLNLTNNFELCKKSFREGYVMRAQNSWHPVPSSPEVRQRAEDYLGSQLGERHRASIADDMDFFIVDRQGISDTPVADS